MSDDIREIMADAYRRAERNAIEKNIEAAYAKAFNEHHGLIEIYESTIRRCAWISWYDWHQRRADRMLRDERIKQQAFRDTMRAIEAQNAIRALEAVGAQMREHDAADGYEPTEEERLS